MMQQLLQTFAIIKDNIIYEKFLSIPETYSSHALRKLVGIRRDSINQYYTKARKLKCLAFFPGRKGFRNVANVDLRKKMMKISFSLNHHHSKSKHCKGNNIRNTRTSSKTTYWAESGRNQEADAR